jgi:hypothetical protein
LAGSEPRLCKWGKSVPGGQSFLKGLDLDSKRHRKRSCTNLTDGDGGVSKEKELVHAGNEDSPDETDDPSTEGRRRHRGIVCVGNRRTDFWIRGFILKGKGGWVKVWVVKFIDGDALLMLRVFR